MRAKKLFSICNLLSVALITAISAASPATAEMTTVQESKPLVARAGAWQTWNDRLHIKQGLERRKLLLTFANGADGRKKMTGIHVQLARKPFAEIKDFTDGTSLSKDLKGTVSEGDIPITVQGYGPSGARLVWKLVTDSVIVSGITPNPFKPGDNLTVQGANFSDQANDVTVTMDGKPVKVTSVKNDEIKLTAPSSFSGSNSKMIVIANSVKSAPFNATVKGAPEILDIDHIATAPQHPVVIAGKDFSKVLSENVVTFGSIKGRVTRCSETRITAIVPNMVFPAHIRVFVTVRGIPARGSLDLLVQQIVIPKGEHLLNGVHFHPPHSPAHRSL